MGKCKSFSILCLVLSLFVSLRGEIARADVLMRKPEVSHYTETSWLPQQDDVVVDSKLKMEFLKLGPVRGYGGAVLEQDTRSNNKDIYNDNGISPMIGAWTPLVIPELGLLTEYRQTFRVINRPDSRQASQPELVIVTYGYDFTRFGSFMHSGSFFQEEYGDFTSRSNLSFSPILGTWSKTGARFNLSGALSLDSFLDIEFRRSSTGEPEDNFQSLGPGLRFNLAMRQFSASLSAHEELGDYTNRSGAISRWKGLFVISGAL